MIRVENISKAFGELKVLENVSAEIKKGDCVAVIGPSGTGKSVFLSCLNGLIRPDSGRVYVQDKDVTDKKSDINAIRRKMGMVYQNFNLFSHMTIMENIILAPMKVKKIPREEVVKKALGLLETVSLADKANEYPRNLSGGQQQRIAIARAMAMEPEIVLFDEPTSALDPTMVGEVLAVIRAFAKQGITMLIVTHEMEFAREVSNRVFFMEDKGIYEQGTPEQIFDNPQKPKTKAFVEKLKTLSYEIASTTFDFIALCSEIERFCIKYRVNAKTVYNINLVIEETVFYLLKNGISNKISLIVSYSDKTKSTEISIGYDGEKNNIYESDAGDIGLMMAKSKSRDIYYSYADKNLLKISF